MTELERWARAEREFLRNEIKWLKAGGQVLSPSGEDITRSRIEELETRHAHVLLALGD